MHELTISYRFEHTNHDILLNILFQNFYNLFLRARNLYRARNIFHIYVNVKIFFFREQCFIKLFLIITVFIRVNSFSQQKMSLWLSWLENLFLLKNHNIPLTFHQTFVNIFCFNKNIYILVRHLERFWIHKNSHNIYI